MDTRHWAQVLRREKERLQQRLGRLRAQARVELSSSIQELSRYDNDPADIGTETFERTKDQRFLAWTQKQIREIEDAQERLADGTYGICGDCGKPIHRRRLEARPQARLCFPCAERRPRATSEPHLGAEYNPHLGPRDGWPEEEPGEEGPRREPRH